MVNKTGRGGIVTDTERLDKLETLLQESTHDGISIMTIDSGGIFLMNRISDEFKNLRFGKNLRGAIDNFVRKGE